MRCFDVSFMCSHDLIALCAYVIIYGRTNRLLSFASDPYYEDDDQSLHTSNIYSSMIKINHLELKRQSQSLIEDSQSQSRVKAKSKSRSTKRGKS